MTKVTKLKARALKEITKVEWRGALMATTVSSLKKFRDYWMTIIYSAAIASVNYDRKLGTSIASLAFKM